VTAVAARSRGSHDGTSGRGRARRLVASALGAVLLTGGSGCRDRPRDPADPIVVAIAVAPNNLDPRVGVDEASQRVHQLLFGSLARLDERLQVVPDLAVRWDTPDDRTYVVTLRTGVRFHDGRLLTAADVVFTYASFLDQAFMSPRKGAYRLLDSVRALDRDRVEFRLKEPFGSFPINLVMGIVPDGAQDVSLRPVGTGPYRFVRFAADDRVEVARFDEYYGGPVRNSGVVLKIVPDDTMRGLELRKGTVDVVVNDLAPDIVHQLETERRLRFFKVPGADYAYVGLNLRDPLFADVRVRHALGYAIDRDAIVTYLRRGLATPAVGVLPPMSWAFEPDVFQFTYDPTRSRALLDEAGFPDPDGDGPLPRLRFTLKTSTAEFVRLQATVIQQQLRAIGVAADVRSHEFATLLEDVQRGNFQAFTLQWVGVSDPDMLRRAFHSAQMPPGGFNRGFFSDPRVDRLVDEATRTLEEGARRRLYAEAQRRIAGAAPCISLWYKTNVVVSQPDVRGVTLSPTADFSFLTGVWREPAAPAASAAR
jgi:peptide/nickel transport system substrate-binding protein